MGNEWRRFCRARLTGHCSIQVKVFPNKAWAITTLERLINLIMKFIDPYKSLSRVKIFYRFHTNLLLRH